MKKLFTALALCVSAFAMEKACADGWHDGYHNDGGYHDATYVSGHDGGFLSKSSLELRAGYRTDSLNFRIGSPTEVPDTLSKVHFDSLRIWQFGGTLRSSFCDCFYFRGDVNVGKIYSGKSRVTNYDCFCRGGRNRSHEFKRRTGRGDVWDVSAALGYQICACDNQLRFVPLIGYAVAEQRVRRFGPVHGFAAPRGVDRDRFCRDGCDDSYSRDWSGSGSDNSSVAAQPASIAKYSDHRSSDCCFDHDYCPSSRWRARWTGPWLGFDAAYNLNCNVDVYGGFEYHWAHFSGKGHWDFQNRYADNFSQGANGDGQIYTFGLNWNPWDCWNFGLEVKFQQWNTRRGHDRSYFNSDDSSSHCDRPSITYNRLNYVKWDSFAISFATAYLF